MTIRRGTDPQDNFQILPHQTSRDARLSFKARGLLAMMLSYPADWIFSREWLAKQSEHDGATSVRSALKELEECGYLTRTRVRDKSGHILWEQILHRTARKMEKMDAQESAGDDEWAGGSGGLPSAENPPMDPTSQNSANAQVAPLVGFPPVDSAPTEEECSNEDCDEDKKTSTRSFSARHPKDRDQPPEGSASARGTRLPKPFPVAESMRTWAADKAPHCGLSDHEAFCDYWWSTPGTRGRKVDWEAAWRNWMRRAQADATRYRPAPNGHPGNGRRPSTTDERVQTALDLGREMAREMAEHGRLLSPKEIGT